MIKKTLVKLAACTMLFIMSASCVKSTRPDTKPIPSKLHPIVKLYRTEAHWFKPDRQVFVCTGFVVSDRQLFTAAHCVSNEPLEVRGAAGEPTGVYAFLKGSNNRLDLAIMSGDFKSFNHVTVSDNLVTTLTIALSNQVIACGYPEGGSLFCSELSNPEQSSFGIKAVGFLYPGMSGGPVFDKDTEVIIGINSAVWSSGVQYAPLVEIYAACNVTPEP